MSILTSETWTKYVTISGMADKASKDTDQFQPGSHEWYKAWGISEGLRLAAIEMLSDIPAND